jgi:hypothetical protein
MYRESCKTCFAKEQEVLICPEEPFAGTAKKRGLGLSSPMKGARIYTSRIPISKLSSRIWLIFKELNMKKFLAAKGLKLFMFMLLINSALYIFWTKMLREAKSSVMNFTGRVFFTLSVKFITLGAASLGR